MLNTANQVCSICRDARRKGDVARAPASFVNRIRSVAAASVIAICVLTLPGMAHAAITCVASASNPGDTGKFGSGHTDLARDGRQVKGSLRRMR